MRYQPFRKANHPKIFQALASYSAGILVQRNVRNIRYYDEELAFTLLSHSGPTEVVVSLDDERFSLDAYDLVTRNALSFMLSNLAAADEQDLGMANANYSTQYALTNSFRALHSYFGGRRYVAICRDMIDQNMGKCLQPYMYEDLVEGIYTNFNKSIGKDIYGLNDAIVEMIEDLSFSSDELRRIISLVGNKASADGFHHFAIKALESPKISEVIRQMIVDAYSPVRFNGREVTPPLTEDLFPYFAKEELCELLRTLPRGMKETVRAIFEYLGPEADHDYAVAYLQNISKDLEVLYDAPCYPNLPHDVKSKLSRSRALSPKATNMDIIRFYETVENEEESEQILKFCEDYGKKELKKALMGHDFIPLSFSLSDLIALSHYVSYQTPVMAPRINAYLSRYVAYRDIEPQLDEMFLLLHGEEFKDLVQTALANEVFHSPAVRLTMADRYGLTRRLGLKEWKYHD